MHEERLAKDRDSLAYWDVAASCLRCLYDIKLYSSETSLHTSEHLDMDADSANAIYLLVEPELLDAVRNRKGVGLRSDLKAVVDKATNALGELDLTRYPHVSMNADAVDSYLDGTAMPTFAQIRNVLCCVSADSPTLNIPMIEVGSSSGIPAAHLTLPFVRAAAQHELLRQRMKSGMARAVEDYDVIIDDYKLNLALNVNSSEGWLHLGLAYADLADEALLGTANEIVESKHDIAVLQRSALACLIQAMQFLPPSQGKNASKENEDEDEDEDDEESNELARKLHVRVFSLSGLLLYRIASSPLSLLAFKVLPSNVLVSDDEVDDSQHWDLGKWCSRNDSVKQLELSRSLAKRFDPPPRDYVYRLARRMFARASDLDSSNWKWSYMLGKSMSKLGDRLSACACYLKACHVVSRRSGSSISSATGVQQNAPSTANASATELPLPPSSTQPSFSAIADVAVDAHYKLLSSIAKMLCASKIDVPTARRFLTAMPYALPAEEDCIDRAVAAHGSATEDICLDTDPKPLSDDVLSILKQIRAAVVQMCSADKRRWHHRPYYLLAWIDVRIVNSHEQAKQTLLSLLQMRNSTKQLASFYKTEFEAPGKHYLYLEKYLKLYVEVLVSTSDIEGIQLLQRKLKRSSESLYDPSELATMASEAEIKILQKLTSRLNCPRLVVDELQKEHIILEHALAGVDRTRIFSITRHCRLNRSQFNHARDLAKDNISHFTALREHLNRVLRTLPASAPEDAGVSQNAELQLALQTVDQYLDCARNATQLFAYLLEQKKKHAEDYANISTLNDCMADLYILLLYTYGQDNCILHLPPHQEGNVDSLVSLCRESTAPIAASLRAQRPEGAFWHGIIFDEARNESSQQYKLLNPLLEFCINKLLDSVREAESLKANRFVCLASVDSGSSLPAPPAAAAPTSSSSAN
ncbi:Histone transcription regulator 3 [Dipsacomyces acuminosporus]|nr:Histone transcription regulator 3 [Dipsacomyces acuminosporus]